MNKLPRWWQRAVGTEPDAAEVEHGPPRERGAPVNLQSSGEAPPRDPLGAQQQQRGKQRQRVRGEVLTGAAPARSNAARDAVAEWDSFFLGGLVVPREAEPDDGYDDEEDYEEEEGAEREGATAAAGGASTSGGGAAGTAAAAGGATATAAAAAPPSVWARLMRAPSHVMMVTDDGSL
eukprot:CAMPEP_0197604420 /NCGR_PEP_ID=MMETSP1326-20131121/41138_1 /TAXON_ID=1155430 /ORGANISM="Genus nov. species nov., Strain RCC2288" /LENGTH=177 /DNA_ID=CAMNT_0043172075 /DNA_START=71 /DNA_END=600 /DNA_ORIENTATION=-